MNSYLECMGSADDEKRARSFIYYLQADSDADEWFEELLEEEKKSWASIEVIFRRKWLKQEVIGTKKVGTIENEPQVSLHSPKIAQNPVSLPHKPSDTTTTPPTTSSVSTKPRATVAMSQSPAPFENRKIHSTNKILRNFTDFSSSTPSPTSLDLLASTPITSALETRSTVAAFTQKLENIEISPIIIKTALKTPSVSVIELENDATRVSASPPNPNDAVLRPPTPFTSASSSWLPATGDEKRVLLRAVFETQQPTESQEPTTTFTALKSRSESTGFTENIQKVEKSPIFAQNAPEPIISGHSKCEDNIDTSPAPTTIVSDLETCSEMAVFMKNHKNHRKSSIHQENVQCVFGRLWRLSKDTKTPKTQRRDVFAE